ncbi:MAG: hemolysin III family protein [Prevotella sp.]|nr:hemolysin III family protein [Prevotella sp.]
MLPSIGTVCTNGWYGSYQCLVRRLPTNGTTAGYAELSASERKQATSNIISGECRLNGLMDDWGLKSSLKFSFHRQFIIFADMNIPTRVNRFTHREELWNAWSHAAGIVIGLCFGGYLLFISRQAGNHWAVAGMLLYLFGMLSSYVSSTIYHASPQESPWKQRLRKWDHAAIYWHIAGSYSPIMLVAMRQQGYWGWSLLVFVWLCAVVGTVLSFRRIKQHSHLKTLFYVAMGMSVVIAIRPMLNSLPLAALYWIAAEGVFNILGAIFYSLYRRRYMHCVFHFFILAGTICHLMAIWHMLFLYL